MDTFGFWKILSVSYGKFHKFYTKTFFAFHFFLNIESQTQSRTTFFLEITSIIRRICLSLDITEVLKETENCDPRLRKLYPPQVIFNWPGGTLVPEDLRILVFVDYFHKKLRCGKIHSIMILSKTFHNPFILYSRSGINDEAKISSFEAT